MESVRVGVWGVGAWGEKHARVYHELAGAELIGVHDHHPGRADEVAERYGCRAFPSPEALLAECEAVSIALPTMVHREAFARTAQAGRHALVEKPLAATLEDADAMLAAAARAGTRLQVGHVERFNPAFLAARPHVSAPKFIEAHRLALFQPRSLDIDVVFDLMIHDIDIVLDAVGAMPKTVSAVGVAVLSDNEDIANARLEFADGCVANLTASRVSQDRLRRIRFFQRDAYLSVDLLGRSGEMLLVDDTAARAGETARTASAPSLRPTGFPPLSRQRFPVEAAEPLTLELQAFVRSLAGEGPGAASEAAGRAALAVATEVRAAMKRRARQWAIPTNVAS